MPPGPEDATAPAGTRRQRLWELPGETHGPIVGVCLPVAELRRLMDKLFGSRSSFDDHRLHQGTVSQCATRNKVSDALQRELDRRFADTLRSFREARDTPTLAALWAAALQSGDVAAALWAALTHSRCDAELRQHICSELHMLQWRLVDELRFERARNDALAAENRKLGGDLARVRLRQQQSLADGCAERAQREAELRRLRAETTDKSLLIARLQQQQPQARLDIDAPARLEQHLAELNPRVRQRQAEEALPRRPAAWPRAAHPGVAAPPAAPAAAPDASPAAPAPEAGTPQPALASAAAPLPDLQSCSVLCVGGRNSHVALYRQMVERHGGRFAHHDGGVEDNAHRLERQLAAADVVICQSGCLNHNAYVRVKDHCKRTGKRCVYLDKPGAGSFLRGLAQLPLGA